MARVLGVEFIILVVLGFIIGVLLFLYSNARRDVLGMEQDKKMLDRKMRDFLANANTLEYKRNLIQSDLEQLQMERKRHKERITELSQNVDELNKRLVSTNIEELKI